MKQKPPSKQNPPLSYGEIFGLLGGLGWRISLPPALVAVAWYLLNKYWHIGYWVLLIGLLIGLVVGIGLAYRQLTRSGVL